MKLVREHINEKFSEDSDPIRDMGIGGISLDEIAKKTIRNRRLKSGRDKWLKYLQSLIGKKINGKFYVYNESQKNLIQCTFIIREFRSYQEGSSITFFDKKDGQYHTDKNERYVIK
jgi:hypothetical protein